MVNEINCTFVVYVRHYDGQYYFRRLFSNGWGLTGRETYQDAAIEAVSKMIAEHLQQNTNTRMQFSCTICPFTGEYDIDQDSVRLSDEYNFSNRKMSDDDKKYGKIPHRHARQYQDQS